VIEIEPSFDVGAFYQALDATRRARNLNWKEVAELARVHASTLSRMASGRRPDADSLAFLAAWSGLNPADFVPGMARAQPEALAQLSAFIHNDPQLTPEAAAAFDELVKSTYVRLVKVSKPDAE
jgi:transcriptional regulator with XRE-family HTH domain